MNSHSSPSSTPRWRDDIQKTVHRAPVRRERTNVRVLAGGGRGAELERHRLSRLEQLRRVEDLWQIRHVRLRETARRRCETIAGLADRIQGAGRAENEVVLHHVRIRKGNLNELTRRNIQLGFVELQLTWNDAEP